MQKLRVLVVDDHQLFRQTLVLIINSDPKYEAFGAGDAEECFRILEQRRPDIILMDINLPGMNGMDLSRQIMVDLPAVKIMGLTSHTETAFVKAMMKIGAKGYLTKHINCQDLMEALEVVQAGGRYICQEIKDQLAKELVQDPPSEEAGLSQREMEVIRLIQKGSSSKEIAEALYISVKTVEQHRYHILKKLNLKNAAALVNYIHQKFK